MITQDENFPKKLTGYLDIGTAELKAGTVYRLQNARTAALARLSGSDGVRTSESRLAHAFAGTGGSPPSQGRSLWTSARLWLGIAVIVAAGFGYQQWQAYQQVSDLVDLDAQILSSDLPIDAYLDQGFRNWLAHDEN
jgi:hypothetical protein